MRKHPAVDEESENAERFRHRRLYRALLGAFFLCMIFFTVLSRILDSYRVPRVHAGYAGQGSVIRTVSGDGAVEAEDTKSISLIEGLRISRVEAGPGTRVKTGDVLFYYEVESLLEKRSKLAGEIQKLELANEAERQGAVSYEGVTGAKLAAQELAAANRTCVRMQEKTRRAEEDYAQNVADLKTYYEKRLALSQEELLEQSRSDFNKSRDAYETSQMERDTEIRGIKRKMKDTEKKIRSLEAEEQLDEADEEKLQELNDLLEQYEEALEQASDRWSLALEQAEDDKNEKQDLFDRAEKGKDSTKLELEKNYKSAVKQEEKLLEEAREREQDSALALEKAAQALENARIDDQAKALTAEQTKRLSELRCQSVRLDIDEKKEELKNVENLISLGGAVTAPADGVTALSELEAGKVAGTERYLLSVGALRFKGTFNREEEGAMDAGDEVRIRLESGAGAVTATVPQVDLISDGKNGTFYAKLPDKTGALGETASFECVKRTAVYPYVIPSCAIREDANGAFCLVLQSYKTILGEEFRAARVDLKLLAEGDTQAAVEAALTYETPIITAGDRMISAGDRVRLIMD